MPPDSRPCFRDDATAIVRDRENQYRSPAENFADIAREWAGYLGIDISPGDVCEMMVLMKACRLKGETKRDSIVDLIAYAVDCRNAVEAAKVKPDDAPPKLNDLSHTGYATVAKDEPWGLWDKQLGWFVANIIDGYSLVLTRAEAVARASDSPDYYEARPLP